MFNYQNCNVVGWVDIHPNSGNAYIDVIGYTDLYGQFYSLNGNEAAKIISPRGKVFAHNLMQRHHNLDGCLICISVKPNIAVGEDKDDFIWDKSGDIYEYGIRVKKIKDTLTENGEYNHTVLEGNNLIGLNEDTYILSGNKIYLIKGNSNDRLISFWKSDSLEMTKGNSGKLYITGKNMPVEDGKIDITTDEQLIDWFLRKVIKQNWKAIEACNDYNAVSNFLNEALTSLSSLDPNVYQSRCRRLKNMHMNFLLTLETLKDLSNVPWFDKLVNGSINKYKEQFISSKDEEFKKIFEEKKREFDLTVQMAEHEKDESLNKIRELTKQAQQKYEASTRDLQHRLDDKVLEIEIKEETITKKNEELQKIENLIDKALERKDDLVQDFTIVKEVLGLGENRTALPHAFTNAEEESESNASRTFFLNEITNADNAVPVFQAFKKSLDNVFKVNKIGASSVSTICNLLAKYKIILLPKPSLSRAIILASKRCRFMSEYVSAGWRSFSDLWDNGLEYMVKKSMKNPEMIHYLLLQNINLSYLPNYLQPLIDIQMEIIDKIPQTDYIFPSNLRILCSLTDGDVIPLSKSCLQYIGCIDPKDDCVKEYYGVIKASEDTIGYLSPEILIAESESEEPVSNFYMSYLNEQEEG